MHNSYYFALYPQGIELPQRSILLLLYSDLIIGLHYRRSNEWAFNTFIIIIIFYIILSIIEHDFSQLTSFFSTPLKSAKNRRS